MVRIFPFFSSSNTNPDFISTTVVVDTAKTTRSALLLMDPVPPVSPAGMGLGVTGPVHMVTTAMDVRRSVHDAGRTRHVTRKMAGVYVVTRDGLESGWFVFGK